MKRTLTFTLLLTLLAGLAATPPVRAQAQGRTPPVGYITTTLAPSVNGLSRVNTPFGYPLHASAVFTGGIASVSGNTLNLTGASLPNVTATPYLIHVTTAANASAVGQSFLVTSSSTTSVTASPSAFQLSSLLAANDQVLIYPANTLGSIFGSSNATVKLTGSASAGGADIVYQWNGASWDGYFYSPGVGWLLSGDATQTVQNNHVIYPDRAMLVSRLSTNTLLPTDILVNGTVPQNSQTVTISAPGMVFIANPLPLTTTLASLGLAGNGGWQDGATAGDADIVCAFQSGTWATFYHIATLGWVLDSDANYGLQDTFSIPATSGVLVVRQSTAASPSIQVPLSYTVN